MAQGIKQRGLSLPLKRCGNELGKEGTACNNPIQDYLLFLFLVRRRQKGDHVKENYMQAKLPKVLHVLEN